METMRWQNPCSQPAKAPDEGLCFSPCNGPLSFTVQSHHLVLRAQDARDDQNRRTPGSGASTDATLKDATKCTRKVPT